MIEPRAITQGSRIMLLMLTRFIRECGGWRSAVHSPPVSARPSEWLVLPALLMLAASPGRTDPAGDTVRARSTIRDSVGFGQGWNSDRGPYWFLNDTGAHRSALDSKVAASLGLKVTGSESVEGSAGSAATGETLIPELVVGGLTVPQLRPLVYDLSASLAPEHERTAGIIGIDALGRSSILWDTVHGKVVITNSAPIKNLPKRAALISFRLDNGVPLIRARLDGISCPLRIDTGASIGEGPDTFVNVTQKFYARWGRKNVFMEPTAHFGATGIGGPLQTTVVAAHRLSLGAVRIDRPRLIVQPAIGYFARSDAVGFLGLYAFHRWRGLIVDYPRRRLILLPRSPSASVRRTQSQE